MRGPLPVSTRISTRAGSRVRALFATLLAVLLMTLALPQSPAGAAVPGTSNGGVRIMPLGDSITDGYTPYPGGYRVKLWQDLSGAGYRVDFVGSQTNGPSELGDPDHEGHPGWRIDQLDANIVSWLDATDPRTVLLHIGTNDLNQNYDVANAPARLSTLIDHILQTKPDVQLFVAQIITEQGTQHATMVDTYNAAIPAIVASKGPHVHLVDMHAALTADDLADGVHPKQEGYDKMAAVWNAALHSVPSSLSPLPGIKVTNAASHRCLDVQGAATAPGTPTIIYDCRTAANQSWSRGPAADGELRAYGSECLDPQAAGTADGTPVVISPCQGSTDQQWKVNANGTISGVASGKCLTPAGRATANNTAVRLQTCDGDPSQVWALR